MKDFDKTLSYWVPYTVIIYPRNKHTGFKRVFLKTPNMYYSIYQTNYLWYCDVSQTKNFINKEDAMKYCDECLNSYGLNLLTEEEWEKYNILL